MDPSKSGTAPPTDFSGGEKSSMGQSAPPPYYDNPGSGHFNPGYPPQVQPGYGGPPQYGVAGYGQQQYQVQPAAIIAQPTVYVTQGPLNPPVNDYLVYSIFTMLCCCLPLGVAALIYSISAREANGVGDRLKAEQSSRTARTLNHVALGIGIGAVVLIIVYAVVVASLF